MALILTTEKSVTAQITELLKDYLAISKFKVVAMLVLTAWVGLALAPDMGRDVFVQLASLLGIGLLSAAAAVINHVVDSEIDSKMARTRHRSDDGSIADVYSRHDHRLTANPNIISHHCVSGTLETVLYAFSKFFRREGEGRNPVNAMTLISCHHEGGSRSDGTKLAND